MNRAGHFNGDDNETLRLFAGIACTGLPKVNALLQELRAAAPGLGCGIQVVPEGNLHITLKFLGAAAGSSVAPIAAIMDRIAADTSAIALTVTGTGSFANALWLGIDPPGALNELASSINNELQLLGFRRETRPYVPHLTLARLRQPAGPKLKAWIDERNHDIRASLQIHEIHLYNSITLPTGSHYSILHTALLNLR